MTTNSRGLLSKLRDFLFIDKARSEREYQRVKYCVDNFLSWTGGYLSDTRIFPKPEDPREVYYDRLYDIPQLAWDLYDENKELKARVKKLEVVNKALLENTKVVILSEELK